MEHKLL
jgi:hypothetical protein